MLLIKIFITGLGVLAGAIALNYIAGLLGLTSWYTFLQKPKDTTLVSYLWLFVIYPLGLGALAYLFVKILIKF